jgi:hypothetical protein
MPYTHTSTLLYSHGWIDFDQFKKLIAGQRYSGTQNGRYFVALSLAEAESVRAALHMAQGQGLFSFGTTMIGLHNLSLAPMLMDCSDEYLPGDEYQQTVAEQSFRFADADLHFARREGNMLLRALQTNTPEERKQWYLDIRACKRRKQLPLDAKAGANTAGNPTASQTLSVQRVMETKDETSLIEHYATTVRVRELIKSRGMGVLDAFRAFNSDHTGQLNCSQLYGGLDWLGLKLVPDQIQALVRELDSDHDGLLNFIDFKNGFWQGDRYMLCNAGSCAHLVNSRAHIYFIGLLVRVAARAPTKMSTPRRKMMKTTSTGRWERGWQGSQSHRSK